MRRLRGSVVVSRVTERLACGKGRDSGGATGRDGGCQEGRQRVQRPFGGALLGAHELLRGQAEGGPRRRIAEQPDNLTLQRRGIWRLNGGSVIEQTHHGVLEVPGVR